MKHLLADHQEKKAEVVATLRKVCDFLSDYASQFSAGSDRWEALREVVERLVNDEFNVVVAGEFSSGKSFLINVMLGAYEVDSQKGKVRGLLPDRISPTTSAITVIKSGSSREANVIYEDGTEKKVPLEEVWQYIADPSHKQKYTGSVASILVKDSDETESPRIKLVEVEHESPLLSYGVRIIDTPGTGSVIREHAEVTKQFIPQADVILFLFPAQPPINEPTRLFLSECAFHVDRMFFIQTMKDREYKHTSEGWKPHMEREKRVVDVALEQNLSIIREVMPSTDRVYSVSARWFALSQRGFLAPPPEESGMPQLLRDIEHFLVYERGMVLLRTALKRALRHLQDTSDQLVSFIQASQSSIEELKSQVSNLNKVRDDVELWLQKVEEQIRFQCRRVEQEVEEDCVLAVNELNSKLLARIDKCSSVRDVRALEEALPLIVSTKHNQLLAEWSAKYRGRMNELYDALSTGSLSQIDISVDALHRLPERTRLAISKLLMSTALSVQTHKSDRLAQVVKSTAESNFTLWRRFLEIIPFLGEWFTRKPVEKAKGALKAQMWDLAKSSMSELKESFISALYKQSSQLAEEMRQRLKSFLTVHLDPVEHEIQQREARLHKEEDAVAKYDACKAQCSALIQEVEKVLSQLGTTDEREQSTDPAPDASDVPESAL